MLDSSIAILFSNTGTQWLETVYEHTGWTLKLFVIVNLQPKLKKKKVANMLFCRYLILGIYLFYGTATSSEPGHHCRGFTLALRRTTLGRTPLDEWSARRRVLYLTTHNTYKRQASMIPVWSEPTIPGKQRPQTHALVRAATGIS